jgi:pimeloyl-ACP methyl ester carboxylesterase
VKYSFFLIFICLSTPLWAQPNAGKSTSMSKMQQLTLPTSGIQIAYTDQGDGPQTLVLIHGLGSNHKGWQKNIDSLAKHARCIALDLPGYGQSSKGDYPYDMAFFAQSIREFIAVLQLKNVVLVGHSMGAQIAITALLQDSTLCQKLVLLAPAGFETFTEQEKTWFSLVYTPAVLKATSEEQIRKNFELNFVQFPSDAAFMIQDRMALRETPEYDQYCAMIPQCVMGMLKQPVWEQLKELRQPTLVLYGEKDLLIPNRILHKTLTTQMVAESGQRRIPNSRLQMIPNTGHFVQWEGASAVNTAILGFLP